MLAQQSIGQKQYEFTNHLGNALAAISDKCSERKSTSTNDIVDYHPALKATYDYYPFGQLMPGRYTQDNTQSCMDVTQTVMVAKWVDAGTLPAPYEPTTSSINLTPISGGRLRISSPDVGQGVNWPQDVSVGVNNITFTTEEVEGSGFRASVSEWQLDDNGTDSIRVELASAMIDGNGIYSIDFTASKPQVEVSLTRGGQNPDIAIASIVMLPRYKKLTYVQENTITRVCNNQDGYRFGFNGQMKVNEIAGIGNWVDYKARMYDSRIVRFKSVDPLTSKFPWYTPYQFAGNQPIESMDLDGLEEYHTRGGELIGKYGTSTEIRVVYDDMIEKAKTIVANKTQTLEMDIDNNNLYNKGSAPVSLDADKLAIGWGKRFNGFSIREDRELNSVIFVTKINGKSMLSYTRPEIGSKPVFGFDDPKEGKVKWSVMGLSRMYAHIHSHGAYGLNDNIEDFSNNGPPSDYDTYSHLGVPGYLATPGGRLLYYNASTGGKAKTPISTDLPSNPASRQRANENPPIDPELINISNPEQTH